MRLTPLIAAVAVASVPAQAFIAWSGSHCDGDKGNDVLCDGSCHSFVGRHSFIAGVHQGETGCVSMWTSSGCSGQRFNFTNQAYGQCTNVNTGTSIVSFKCWTGTVQGCPQG